MTTFSWARSTHLKRKPAHVRVEALELLERIGLRERANEFPDRLSGGQQQRVAIVRSLAMRPSLLLLDEVTSALDPTLVGEVLDLLRDLAKGGTTMLIATHEMNFAKDVSHRVAYLEKGVLVEIGTPEQILTHHAIKRRAHFSSACASSPSRVTRVTPRPGQRAPGLVPT